MYIYEDRIDFGTADHIFHLKLKYIFFYTYLYTKFCTILHLYASCLWQAVSKTIGLLKIINNISSYVHTLCINTVLGYFSG